MPASTVVERGIGAAHRRWRAMGRARRLPLVALIATAGGVGLYLASAWWSSWPSRLTLRVEGGHIPAAYSPDGSMLTTTGTRRGEVFLWDPADGRKRATWPAPPGFLRFGGVFSPDGRVYASPRYRDDPLRNHEVDLIDVATGRVRATYVPRGRGHVGLLAACFREEGKKVRLVETDRVTYRAIDLDVDGGAVLASRTISCPPNHAFAAVSLDGSRLALVGLFAAGKPMPLTVWDLDEDREASRSPAPTGGMVHGGMMFSPDGKSLMTGDDESIEVRDPATGRRRSTLPSLGRDYRPRIMATSAGGSTLASWALFAPRGPSMGVFWDRVARMFGDPGSSPRAELVVLDVGTGRRLARSGSDGQPAVSPDGRTVATSHDDGTVRLHEVPGRP